MNNTKEYHLEIDPAILELLGPSLYTNIYYVLAELIANAYDADAHNVYIIETKNAIIVEDDGLGMSYKHGGVQKFLSVAKETRTTEEETFSPSGRARMGRKGIGKLAALAVSNNVNVLTVFGDDKSGFVLSRRVGPNGKLEPIPEDKIKFIKVKGNGTAIQMLNPQYELNKGIDTIKRNLLKMFPIVNEDFKIHIVKNNQEVAIEEFDKTVITELAALMTFGKGNSLAENFVPEFKNIKSDLLKTAKAIKRKISIKNREGELVEKDLVVEGWIGAYKSTRGRKTTIEEFPDNFISLFSNGKMGEFNIIPRVGQNRLQEVYVVGQFHVDLFEATDLPDMALSNRQGYKSDDIRYTTAIEIIRELLVEIVEAREKFADEKDKDKKKQKIEKQKNAEAEFKKNVDEFKYTVAKEVSENVEDEQEKAKTLDLVSKIIDKHADSLGLKPKIDAAKKKILISQTRADHDLADAIYQMLLFNGVLKKDIIYTNSLDEEARVPEGLSIFDYLRDFFVESYSNKKMYVIYVTSEIMSTKWGTLTEVGANWITQGAHKIFNITPFRPQHPLDDESVWQTSSRDEKNNELQMDELNADIFCVKIEEICRELGYICKSRSENMNHLKTLVTVLSI